MKVTSQSITVLFLVSISVISSAKKGTLLSSFKADEGGSEMLEFPKLSEVTEDEINQLEQFTRQKLTPKSNSNLMKTMIEDFSFEASRTLPGHLRVILFKIQMQYLSKMVFSDKQNLREYTQNASACKPASNKPHQRVSQFNYMHVKRFKGLLEQFGKLTSKWYGRHRDSIARVVRRNVKLTNEDIPEIKAIVNELDDSLQAFYSDLEALRKELTPEFRGLTCSIKNFMNFYGVLPRFYHVYKTTPDGFTKSYRFMDLGELKSQFYKQLYIFMIPYVALATWSNLIREYRFYLSNDPKLSIVQTSQVFLFDLVDSMGQFSHRMCLFTTKVITNYTELEKTIRVLEDAADIHSHPFPDVSVLKCKSVNVLSWAITFLGWIVIVLL